MVFKLSGKTIEDKDVQFENAYSSMVTKSSEKLTVAKASQPENACEEIVRIEFGKVILTMLLLLAKTSLGILVTPSLKIR